ncbi:MAG TPA: hypothetical protein VG938_10195 [Verrucomicrobiae bacterium]|nr:hypothetical protein [Verrucomicrobiae bacterium]
MIEVGGFDATTGFFSTTGANAVAGFVFLFGLSSGVGLLSVTGSARGSASGLGTGFIALNGLIGVLVLALDFISAALGATTGAASGGGAVFSTTFAATLRTFFAGASTGVSAGSVLTALARGLADTVTARRKSGFAVVTFFGFFITTVLATRWRLQLEIKPRFSATQR